MLEWIVQHTTYVINARMIPTLLAPVLSAFECGLGSPFESRLQHRQMCGPVSAVKLAKPSPNASHVALARVEIRQATGDASKIIPERHAGTRLAYHN
jgi:hypothetical protein